MGYYSGRGPGFDSPATTWLPTTFYNSSSRGYDSLFWPTLALNTCNVQTYRVKIIGMPITSIYIKSNALGMIG